MGLESTKFDQALPEFKTEFVESKPGQAALT